METKESIYEIIKGVQNKNEYLTIVFIKKFSPIFRKYANSLHYEDAYEEIKASVYEAVMKMNLSKMNQSSPFLLSYIQKICFTKYVELSKKHNRTSAIPFSALTEEQEYCLFSSLNETDQYTQILLSDLKQVLTKSEIEVIYKLFFCDDTVSELAGKKQKSRQTINRTKKRALKKLRAYYEKGG